MPRAARPGRDLREMVGAGGRRRRVAGLVHPQHEGTLGVGLGDRVEIEVPRGVERDGNRAAPGQHRAHVVARVRHRGEQHRVAPRVAQSQQVRQRRDELLGSDARSHVRRSRARCGSDARSTAWPPRAARRCRPTAGSPSTGRAHRPRPAPRPRARRRRAYRSSSRRHRRAGCRRAAPARSAGRRDRAAGRTRPRRQRSCGFGPRPSIMRPTAPAPSGPRDLRLAAHRVPSLNGRVLVNSANWPASRSDRRARTRVPSASCTSTKTSPVRWSAARTSARS